MRYSFAFKESLIKKVLPPEGRSVRSVAKEAGVAEQSLHNWLSKSKEGTLAKGDYVGGANRSPREKLRLLSKRWGEIDGYFNSRQHNSYKHGTPTQILHTVAPDIPEEVLTLKPVVVDTLYRKFKDVFRSFVT